MAEYLGEYGEDFVGIGYSHPSSVAKSADGTAPTGSESSASTARWESNNSSSYYQYGGLNDTQPGFVAAQSCDGNNSPADPQIPSSYNQQQQQQHQHQQLEKDAEFARSKAQDILRNIMNGINNGNTNEVPLSSEEHNQAYDNAGTIATNNSGTDRRYSHYGPQTGIDDNTHDASNVPRSEPSQQYQIQNPPSSSIESDAQTARLKAMDILRKFQADSVGADTGNNSIDQSIEPTSSVSRYGPQETQSTAIVNNGVHLIPQQEQYRPSQQVSSEPQPQSPITSSVIPAATPAEVPAVAPILTTPPWELAKRRRECLEKDEERKQRAFFKNLEYVARLEEERLAQQLQEVRQVKTLEQQIDERYRQKIEYRQKKRNAVSDGSNNINTSGAGIGTKQRRKAEAKRQKTAMPPSLRNNRQQKGKRSLNSSNNNSGSDSVAIYVSNLPTDGSFDEATIRGLFSAYGSLRKVHFYLDKSTGKRKGDALVIYSLNEGEDEGALTESVCSQVNGCELPGGSILRVEPSDPYHKVAAKTWKANPQIEQQSQSQLMAAAMGSDKNTSDGGRTEVIRDGTTGSTLETKLEDSGGGVANEEEEEDLDDFFSSLE